MEDQLDNLINKIVTAVLTEIREPTSAKQLTSVAERTIKNKDTPQLLIIENRERPYQRLSASERQALESNFKVEHYCSETNAKIHPSKAVLFLNLSLTVQSKIALGIGDCGLSQLAQRLINQGNQIFLLKDGLEKVSSNSPQPYKQLFVGYQRCLKEFGFQLVTISSLTNTSKGINQVLVTNDIKELNPDSILTISAKTVLSFGAREELKKKNIKINHF